VAAYQLLGYPLLDFHDRYGIDAVGFYLARVPATVTWTLDEVLADVGGPDVTPHRLRDELEDLLIARPRRQP
jgi:hypothetical protein